MLDVIYLFLKENYIKAHYDGTGDLPGCIAGIWEKEKLQAAMEQIWERLCSNADAV